ncbi:MAG TPA: hypothetical protein VMW48_14965, partial [Vicinamibacterales bacterium]|nr:hypothetical protein [Vicinamibacterales bacterium]
WSSLRSHFKGVDWADCTLYLNIDLAPPTADVLDADDVIEAAKQVFGHVVVRVQDEPNFTRAVQWCWRKPTGSVLFYFQADWELTEDIEILELMHRLWSRCPPVDAVNLRAYYGPREARLCLSPVLLQSHVARALADRMVDDVGPEAQLRAPSFRDVGRSLGVGLCSLHWPEGHDRIVVRDIGRKWLDGEGLVRRGGDGFTTWAPMEDEMRARGLMK